MLQPEGAACQLLDSLGEMPVRVCNRQWHKSVLRRVTGDSVRSSQDDSWYCIIESEAAINSESTPRLNGLVIMAQPRQCDLQTLENVNKGNDEKTPDVSHHTSVLYTLYCIGNTIGRPAAGDQKKKLRDRANMITNLVAVRVGATRR